MIASCKAVYLLSIYLFLDAARVASYVMLQEMFQSALLNWLCIYSSLRWTELPFEQRVFEELPSLDYITGVESKSGNMEDEDEVR